MSNQEIEKMLNKNGAVLLNSPTGKVAIYRKEIVAIYECNAKGVNNTTIKAIIDYRNKETYNIVDDFDTVIDKVYGEK